MELPQFRAYLYGCLDIDASETASVRGTRVPCYPPCRNPPPLGIGFQPLLGAFQQSDEIYFEWDGSFTWTGKKAGADWQLDGMIYDRGDQVQYIDVVGSCPRSSWERLLEMIYGREAGNDRDSSGSPPEKSGAALLLLPDTVLLPPESFYRVLWGDDR